MLIVSNSGPLLSFARAGYFDLLHDVVGALTIPDGVPGAHEVSPAAWIMRAQVNDRAFVDQLPQKLHLGEHEVHVVHALMHIIEGCS